MQLPNADVYAAKVGNTHHDDAAHDDYDSDANAAHSDPCW